VISLTSRFRDQSDLALRASHVAPLESAMDPIDGRRAMTLALRWSRADLKASQSDDPDDITCLRHPVSRKLPGIA
jgi:hypothetical protein